MSYLFALALYGSAKSLYRQYYSRGLYLTTIGLALFYLGDVTRLISVYIASYNLNREQLFATHFCLAFLHVSEAEKCRAYVLDEPRDIENTLSTPLPREFTAGNCKRGLQTWCCRSSYTEHWLR
ncbi:hypothetical protein K505DRAFT_128472 [Melanomma pulvis-pyrius CBS 109.77]|uniref:Uncharacterized protein n=1 Tax=Melanomma pulvis-pyrius CBS 109.77 TaxID=1314802 RepID=A0A6A6WT33_9PLEO|nr:hypothetical protein K505DRAFT_128472 [Melanomma pulvis-pyrius CBS 109.77]